MSLLMVQLASNDIVGTMVLTSFLVGRAKSSSKTTVAGSASALVQDIQSTVGVNQEIVPY